MSDPRDMIERAVALLAADERAGRTRCVNRRAPVCAGTCDPCRRALLLDDARDWLVRDSLGLTGRGRPA